MWRGQISSCTRIWNGDILIDSRKISRLKPWLHYTHECEISVFTTAKLVTKALKTQIILKTIASYFSLPPPDVSLTVDSHDVTLRAEDPSEALSISYNISGLSIGNTPEIESNAVVQVTTITQAGTAQGM